MTQPVQKIAVIGGGVAGVTAAFYLDSKYEVTLFEAGDYLGGHTNTIVIGKEWGPDAGTPVDTGFIVLNDKTYPLFNQFLEELGVPIRNSDMSFSFYCERTGLQYSSNVPWGLFADWQNLFRPSFLRMISEIIRFNEAALRDLHRGALGNMSLGEYFRSGNYSSNFVENYIIPMGAAIWSTSPERMFEFPATTFVRFFDNHGLLRLLDRPQWKTVVGGSHSYMKAFAKKFRGTIRKNAPVASVKRTLDGATVTLDDGSTHSFDILVIAAHADEALAMLGDPSEEESRLLGAWTYTKNLTVLHTDISVMPPNRQAWASWNYTLETGSDGKNPVSVSYDMNHLQGLVTQNPYFVTLNRAKLIDKRFILREFEYMHPMYTFDSIASQKELHTLNGVRRTYFCGSYFGYGFHEDAVKSALEVVEAIDSKKAKR